MIRKCLELIYEVEKQAPESNNNLVKTLFYLKRLRNGHSKIKNEDK